MPSRLPSRSQKDLYYKQKSATKLAPVEVQTGGKFRGYEPDVSGLRQTWDGFEDIKHLIPIGDYLQTDDGFAEVEGNVENSHSLPLGIEQVIDGELQPWISQPVVGLVEWFPSPDPGDDHCIVAATANTPEGNGSLFHRVAGATAAGGWTPVLLAGGETLPTALFGTSDRVLHDMAAFTPGAPKRSETGWAGDSNAHVGDVVADLPNRILVWCNGYGITYEPATPVLVIWQGDSHYAQLTADLSGNLGFAAATCCEFQERMVFGATREVDIQYPQRVRWSAVSDASKISTHWEGAGSLDLIEFHTGIIRVLPLGDALAVYSEDGVAFLARTGRATDPFARRYVTKTRGLLGAQALCAIGKDLHFGIFTDGWYTLGQSGEWNRVGLDEANGTRWDREFYNKLSYAHRSQIAVCYDQYRQIVRISFVSVSGEHTAETGSSQPNTMWNLDLRTNTVWPSGTGDYYPTYWAIATQSFSSSTRTWVSLAVDNEIGTGETWNEIEGVWRDYLTETENIPAPMFGTYLGMVYQLSYATVQQGFRVVNTEGHPIVKGQIPGWFAESHLLPAAQIGQFTVPDKLWLNYEDTGSPSVSVNLGFKDTGTDNPYTQSVSIGGIFTGSSQSAYATFRQSLRQIAWYISGSNLVRIRGVRAQLLPTTAEQIRPEGT